MGSARYTGGVSLAELRQSFGPRIQDLARQYGACDIRIFGSTARGEARPGSDLDVLIELDPERGLFDLIGLQQSLEDLLGRRVDVVTVPALSPYIREEVLREAVPL